MSTTRYLPASKNAVHLTTDDMDKYSVSQKK